jgi:predicted nucleic acid-binding protein
MTTAVDTNILLALLIPGAVHAAFAARALADAAADGALILCEAVYAELSAHFAASVDVERFCTDTRLRLEPSGADALALAGHAWAAYARRRPAGFTCARCGANQIVQCGRCGEAIRARQHIVADFLIGAHAVTHADTLLTLDPRFYRSYFPELQIR